MYSKAFKRKLARFTKDYLIIALIIHLSLLCRRYDVFHSPYTMIYSYIKGIPRCIYGLIHLRAGWYVSYTPHMYYAHLRNVLIQLTTSPLVAIVIDEQSFRLRWLSILFTSVFVPHLTTNPSGSIEKQTFRFVQSLLPFTVKAEIWIHCSRDLTWL